MPYVAIKGTFHVVNYSPDGDSIRFKADDRTLFSKLGGRPEMNARQHVQLRLEGIDALETHYSPPTNGGVYHQPEEWARAAVDRLIDFTGIGNVRWDSTHRTIVAADDATRGYILSRSIDKYGRPIAFLFKGNPDVADGSDVHLDAEGLKDSYNFAALNEGLAYPTYYSQLFADLRNALTEAVKDARSANRGLWPEDRTSTGIEASSLLVITDQSPILPKLFRRLVEHMAKVGTAVGFRDVMMQSREPVLDLRTSNFTHFDTFIEQPSASVNIKLTRAAEELVFDPMPLRPANHFSRLLVADGPEAAERRPELLAPRSTFAGEWAQT